MPIKLRNAEPTDAAALAELAERTFRTAFAAQNTAEDMDAHCAASYGVALQAREIAAPDMETFVVEENDRLIAYGQLRWGNAPACIPASNPAEIQRFYVDQPWHGQGVAQALMQHLLARAAEHGADAVWLGVWELNPRAIAFYRKSGFADAGHQVFSVGSDPQRDLVLVRI